MQRSIHSAGAESVSNHSEQHQIPRPLLRLGFLSFDSRFRKRVRCRFGVASRDVARDHCAQRRDTLLSGVPSANIYCMRSTRRVLVTWGAPRFVRKLGVVALALLWGCSAEPHSIVGTWNIREIPNDTWTFSNDGKLVITADNAPYDNGSYTLTNQNLRIQITTERTPPYAITWLDTDKFRLTAGHVELTLYRLPL